MIRASATLPLFALTILSSCSDPRSPAEVPDQWLVSAESALTLTDSSAGPGHEFNGISSGMRLPDGRILVANAGIPELTLFDSTGAFLRAVGRKGQGPGEWAGTLALWPWAADSFAVYDAGVQRWTILGPDLTVARTATAPDSAFATPTWLYRGAIVRDLPGRATPAWVAAALDSVRARDPNYTHPLHALRDATGALWIESSDRLGSWTVYTGPGTPAGAVSLPAGLTPLEIGQGYVLALSRDSLDLEQVSLYALSRPAASAAAAATTDTTAVSLPRDAAVRKALIGLVMAQEMYYATHMSYAAQADSLRLPDGFDSPLFILGADSRHWAAIAVNPATGATCGISIGWPAPVGWVEGEALCGR